MKTTLVDLARRQGTVNWTIVVSIAADLLIRRMGREARNFAIEEITPYTKSTVAACIFLRATINPASDLISAGVSIAGLSYLVDNHKQVTIKAYQIPKHTAKKEKQKKCCCRKMNANATDVKSFA